MNDPNAYLPAGQWNTPTGAAPPTPIGRLNSALGQLSDICVNAERLADDLCGAVPQAVSTSGEKNSLAGGVFGQVTMGADAIESFSSRIQNAISRIRNQMP